jgi:hypothetical protein
MEGNPMGVTAASSRADVAQLHAVPDPPLGTIPLNDDEYSPWRYEPGAGVWCLARTGEHWAQKLSWCPEVIDAVTYATQDGETITRRYAIKVGNQTEVISLGDLARGPGVWGKFAAASGYHGRAITDVLANIVAHQATKCPDLPGYPCFRNDHLVLPPTRYLPDGYTNGEDSSVEALATLTQAIAAYPRAALLMGLSAAAPWIAALRLQPFTKHVLGDSTTGKTTAITAAAALWGVAYKGIVQIWNGTKLSVPGQLRDLGVLPAFRDELGTAGLAPGDRATMFSVIMEGCKRGARTREDLPRPSASWASVLFSTGNIAAVPASHASAGHPKGVIETHADRHTPVIPPEDKARIQALTNADGVAGAWVPFALRLSTTAMRSAVEGAGADLGAPPADGLRWHMWRAMSLAVAGARVLAYITETPELASAALTAAREVIDSSEERMNEIGADHGQRLYDAIFEYLSIRPAAFGLTDPRDAAHTDQMGFETTTRDGKTVLCIFSTKHQEIARAAGIEDVTTALKQLRSDGRLVTSKGFGLKYKTRHADVPVYAYLREKDQNSQNSQNTAGQSPESCSDSPEQTSEQTSEQALGWGADTVGAAVNPEPGPASVRQVPDAVPVCPECGLDLPANPALLVNGRHIMCAPESDLEATEPDASTQAEPAHPEPSVASTAPPVAEPEPQDVTTSRRPVSELDTADELAVFARTFTKHDIYTDASEADIAAALGLFHEVTSGLRWVSYGGQVGQAALARLLATYGSMKPPEELTDERALTLCRELRTTVTRYHIRTGLGRKLRPGRHVTGYDINGQYPGAAGSAELGDGNPVWKDKPRSVEPVWNLPGYVQLGATVRGRAPELKMIKNDGTALSKGDWLPMPVVKYLGADLGLDVSADQVCYWPNHGRRFRAYVEHVYRKPRAALQDMPASLARDMALSALKIMVNDSIGMLRSETWSHGRWYRPDWHDQITSLAEVNALRAIGKCADKPLVKACDSLYWIADHAPYEPAGLTITAQLGKFKLERHGQVSPAMIDAYKAGQPKSFHDAVKAADETRTEGARQ